MANSLMIIIGVDETDNGDVGGSIHRRVLNDATVVVSARTHHLFGSVQLRFVRVQVNVENVKDETEYGWTQTVTQTTHSRYHPLSQTYTL
jgi:hypothetical protein